MKIKKYINLLPPAEQQLVKVEETSGLIKDFGIWLAIALVVLSLFLFATKIFLNERLDDSRQQLATETETLTRLQATEARKEVEMLNADLQNLKVLESQAEKWSAALIELARLLPADMTVDSLSIDRKTLRVEASGHAASRSSVLGLRAGLIESEFFSNVNFPLDNLEKSRNLPWKYRFQLNRDKLK